MIQIGYLVAGRLDAEARVAGDVGRLTVRHAATLGTSYAVCIVKGHLAMRSNAGLTSRSERRGEAPHVDELSVLIAGDVEAALAVSTIRRGEWATVPNADTATSTCKQEGAGCRASPSSLSRAHTLSPGWHPCASTPHKTCTLFSHSRFICEPKRFRTLSMVLWHPLCLMARHNITCSRKVGWFAAWGAQAG